MKETYNISFEKNNVYQARLCIAESTEQAQAYFESIEPAAVVLGVSLNNEGYKPGKPCEEVPDGWTAQEAKPLNDETEEITMNTYTIYERMTAELEAKPQRSAWDRGVTAYALELVEALEEAAAYNKRNPETAKECAAWLLNGAQDWEQYSYGGSALVYDCDIAERLCTPSELKRNRNGERRPNSREEWLDTQARALWQACNRVSRMYGRIIKEG